MNKIYNNKKIESIDVKMSNIYNNRKDMIKMNGVCSNDNIITDYKILVNNQSSRGRYRIYWIYFNKHQISRNNNVV